MYKTTLEFLEQSTKSHLLVTKFEVRDSSGEVYTLEGVANGDVRGSEGEAIRRDYHGAIVITSDFTIAQADDLLQPAGTEVKPYLGFQIDGEDEYVPQGVFEIETYEARETNDGILVDISGYDRAFTAQKPTVKPYSVKGGTNGAEALRHLVESMVPRAKFLGNTAWTAPSLFFPADTDRWAEAQKLAQSFGAELGFNVDGDCIMADAEATQQADPVWRFVEGEDGCTFTNISKVVKTDHLRTGVVVIGTNSSLKAEVRGEAWDMRQNSPTYRYGLLGERPYRVYSELPLTTGQAQAMAQKLLSKVLAGSDTVRLTCPPMPSLDLSDVIDVVWPRCRIDGRYSVQEIDMPLDGSPMTITASRGTLVWTH